MAKTLLPERTAERLCELSADARAAVLLDAAGTPAGAYGVADDRSRELGDLARGLFEAVDRARRDIPGGPPEQVEAQVEGGTVYASRTPRWTLAVVARRAALSSLMLMDLRAVLGELEGGPPIRRSVAAADEAAGSGPASEELAAGESPIPELGQEHER
jgi:predicted regulator of Ras-like GTPase activity (Roadblock/LC7/MglB family)